MCNFYVPLDSLAYNRMTYENCRQHKNEEVDEYYIRFLDAVSNMDIKPLLTLQVSEFVFDLQGGYKKILAQYKDRSTFQGVIVEMVFERIDRGQRMGHDFGESANSSNSQRNAKYGKSLEHRISNNSKTNFKSRSQHKRSNSESKPLTE